MTSSGVESGVMRFAASYSAAYVAWLITFVHFVEPGLRRCLGLALRCRIVWLPSLGPYRVWGSEPPGRAGPDGVVALVGSALTLFGALVPMLGPGLLDATWSRTGTVAAARFFLSFPMTAHFIHSVLSRAESSR